MEQINAGLRTQKLQLFYQQLNGLLFGVENLLVIWLGATMVMDGQFSVGILMAFNARRWSSTAPVGWVRSCCCLLVTHEFPVLGLGRNAHDAVLVGLVRLVVLLALGLEELAAIPDAVVVDDLAALAG